MARFDKIDREKSKPVEKVDADLLRRQKMAVALEAGDVIQMQHPGYGVSYVDNDPATIERKKRQGFVAVEYEEVTVKRVVVKSAEPAPAKAKRRSRSNKEAI